MIVEYRFWGLFILIIFFALFSPLFVAQFTVCRTALSFHAKSVTNGMNKLDATFVTLPIGIQVQGPAAHLHLPPDVSHQDQAKLHHHHHHLKHGSLLVTLMQVKMNNIIWLAGHGYVGDIDGCINNRVGRPWIC